MKYKNIKKAVFIKRPNRFIAHVLIDGAEEVVHVKNTGRCAEILKKGASVVLECANNCSRKTRYSLISVYKGETLINMDSQIPNAVVYEAVRQNRITEVSDVKMVKREVTFGNSRFDLYYETDSSRGYIEVKGVTLETDGIAMFPDAPTERGTKHVYEMIEAVRQGYEGCIFFLIQMRGPEVFKPYRIMDPEFSVALHKARNAGVRILAYDSIVTEDGIEIGKPIRVEV